MPAAVRRTADIFLKVSGMLLKGELQRSPKASFVQKKTGRIDYASFEKQEREQVK